MPDTEKLNPHASAFNLYQRMVNAERDTRDFEVGVAMLAAYFECPADWLGVADAAACKGWNN